MVTVQITAGMRDGAEVQPMELTSSPTTATIPILFAKGISNFSRAKRCIRIGNYHSGDGYVVHFLLELEPYSKLNQKVDRISIFIVTVSDLNTPFCS